MKFYTRLDKNMDLLLVKKTFKFPGMWHSRDQFGTFSERMIIHLILAATRATHGVN